MQCVHGVAVANKRTDLWAQRLCSYMSHAQTCYHAYW